METILSIQTAERNGSHGKIFDDCSSQIRRFSAMHWFRQSMSRFSSTHNVQSVGRLDALEPIRVSNGRSYLSGGRSRNRKIVDVFVVSFIQLENETSEYPTPFGSSGNHPLMNWADEMISIEESIASKNGPGWSLMSGWDCLGVGIMWRGFWYHRMANFFNGVD